MRETMRRTTRVLIPGRVVLIASLGLVGTGCAAAQWIGQRRTPVDVPRVSMEDFRRLQTAGAVLVVDVRSDTSYKIGHIPGAINVPVATIGQRAEDIRARARDRLIVTYCSCLFEHASATAAAALIERGLWNSRALIGGYLEWVARGGPVERSQEGTAGGVVRPRTVIRLPWRGGRMSWSVTLDMTLV
jgi:rhodanese-related sulfurtransferase